MKIVIAIALIVSALQTNTLIGECFKCEEIKEKNKKLPPLKHKYYDDYLEELRAEGKPTPGDIEFINDDVSDRETKENK